MDAERWRQISALYHEARAREGDARRVFLQSACGADVALLQEVESLLVDSAAAEAFLAGAIAGDLRVLAGDRLGTMLGGYRIDGVLGRGGMGTVYEAYDTLLQRRVAVKVLAGDTDDETVRTRLLREARNAAALVHPGICTVYEVGEAEGTAFIVMEHIDGVSLRELIDRRGIPPLGDVLAWATEAAGALAYAHERGVVHRDFKTANVIVTPGGRIKIIDFGLARRTDLGLTQATTMSSVMPAGVVAGTPYAMAPEQVRGTPADARTDIWAVGVLLYELTTGVQPFGGASPPALFSAIVADPPRALPDSVDPSLRHIIGRCLEKNPARRYQSADELRRDLDAIGRVTATPGQRLGLAPRSLRRRIAFAALFGSAIAVAAAGVWRMWSGRPQPVAPLRATFAQLTSVPGVEWFPHFSPDGRWIVYAGDAAGNMDIYLQSVAGQRAINLTQDSAAEDDQPAFSPDGEQIAFRSSRDGGGIFVMGRTGEAVRRLTRAGFNPSWSPDGRSIVFATEGVDINPQNSTGRSGLAIVRVAGGDPMPLDIQARDAVLPRWSPHGTRIAFMARLGNPPRSDIRTIAPGGGDSVPVTEDVPIDWNPVWSPDGRHLYFGSDRGGTMNLWRVAIDEQTGRPLSQPEPITTPGAFVGHIAVAADGRLAFASMARSANIQKLSIDPSSGQVIGEPSTVTTGTRTWSNPDPSPDGEWVAFYSGLNPVGHLYVQRIDGTGLRQLTSDDAVDRMPHWSPDGRWLLFFSNRSGGGYELWKIHPDGSELQQVTYAGQATYAAWSPDGRRIATTVLGIGPRQRTYVAIFDATRPWRDQTPEILPLPPTMSEFGVTSWIAERRLIGQVTAGGVAVYSLASRKYERLTAFGEWPAALPDDRHVLFVSDLRRFFVLDIDTKAVSQVFSVQRDVIGPPRVTRDGRTAFFSRRVTESDIWLATLDDRR